MTRRSVSTYQRLLHGIHLMRTHTSSASAAIIRTPASTSWPWPDAKTAPTTRRMSATTNSSQRKSGRVAIRTRSAGSRMRSPGASPRLSRSDTRGMLGGERPSRRHFVRRAGRTSDEVVEQPQWRPTGRRHAVKVTERATAVGFDLALEQRTNAEIVEDGADPVHVLGGQRRLRGEELIELRADTRRRALEREDHRERLLTLHQIVHLDLSGALSRGPDAE